jgi:hypothetical protein
VAYGALTDDEQQTVAKEIVAYLELCNWISLVRVNRRDRPYQGGRSRHWIKAKNRKHPAMER